jgi:IclR family transcriptional regulator, pca regulon regulatory protein
LNLTNRIESRLCALRTYVRYENIFPPDVTGVKVHPPISASAKRANVDEFEDSKDYVQSLERGLSVLRAFNADHPHQTLADVAKATDLTRATARRLLHTLVHLGYVRTDGKLFQLSPKVLDLGYAYVSSMQLSDIAMPYMEELSQRVHESISAAVLDGEDIVYVARVSTSRILAISLSIGSRLPALWTSMGRVLLSGLPQHELDEFLSTAVMEPPAPRGLRTKEELCTEIRRVRDQGYCLLDQELEQGVRSIAAPLKDRSGRVIAGMNVSAHAGRVTLDRLRGEILPELLGTAAEINRRLAKR